RRMWPTGMFIRHGCPTRDHRTDSDRALSDSAYVDVRRHLVDGVSWRCHLRAIAYRRAFVRQRPLPALHRAVCLGRTVVPRPATARVDTVECLIVADSNEKESRFAVDCV